MDGLVGQAQGQPPAPQAAPTQPAPPPAQAPQGGLATQAQAPGPEGDAATPEEQEAYDAALKMASELIHTNDQSSAQIIQMLGDGEDPIKAVSNVVEFVMSKIEETFQNQLPETVVLPAADEITDLVIELGEESGAFDMSDEQIIQTKGGVVRDLMESYGVSPEEMQPMLAELNEEDLNSYQQMFGG